MTGTIEEIYSQLTKINPSFDADFATVEESNNIQGSNLEKRSGIICGPGPNNWDKADWIVILEGIRYLRKVNGQPTNGPGPGACGRVSCSYKSAIWWCNDNSFTFSLPSFGTIADCAQAVGDSCQDEEGNLGIYVSVRGQNFVCFHHSQGTVGKPRCTKLTRTKPQL